MKASEAQALSEEARIPKMEPIFLAIESAARSGKMHLRIPISEQLSYGKEEVVKKLEALGYKITDKENRDKLHISWSRLPAIESSLDDPRINADDFAP